MRSAISICMVKKMPAGRGQAAPVPTQFAPPRGKVSHPMRIIVASRSMRPTQRRREQGARASKGREQAGAASRICVVVAEPAWACSPTAHAQAGLVCARCAHRRIGGCAGSESAFEALAAEASWRYGLRSRCAAKYHRGNGRADVIHETRETLSRRRYNPLLQSPQRADTRSLLLQSSTFQIRSICNWLLPRLAS